MSAAPGDRIAELIRVLQETPAPERLVVMRQNPADSHRWSKAIGPMLYPFELAAYLQVGLEAVEAARAIAASAALTKLP